TDLFLVGRVGNTSEARALCTRCTVSGEHLADVVRWDPDPGVCGQGPDRSSVVRSGGVPGEGLPDLRGRARGGVRSNLARYERSADRAAVGLPVFPCCTVSTRSGGGPGPVPPTAASPFLGGQNRTRTGLP